MDDVELDRSNILRSLVTISRRGVADARSGGTPLSITDQSIVGYIAERPGVRSTDIAQDFRLNRSTVSRQLAGLMRLGLVRERSDSGGRGRPLELTEAGEHAYRETLKVLQRVIDEHLTGWSDAEIARFARDLERFNKESLTRATKKERS
ncbi:MarR family winged helix-turn-helix transcriptional regulator [Microbacterium tenebrionis]|uniref:Winged helix-turn-helix transcriptional regulator n=1 Tax=Microbacterium tenebrionis TaxID=2830665 RepID=A0A9X1RZU1_9MICO|nr:MULTISPECIES: MarR family winged helix-turn-helix transcriptional regulator [Microbacterium]MCC2029114.1 winged helix-turn-helix transcriptional regulator [Microbacterium tenebrionis]